MYLDKTNLYCASRSKSGQTETDKDLGEQVLEDEEGCIGDDTKKASKSKVKAKNNDNVKTDNSSKAQDIKDKQQSAESVASLSKKSKPFSVFKRIERSTLYSQFGRIVTAKTDVNGKPFKIQMLAKDIVRYNAKFISEKLRIANTKYCLVVKKLIDSCMANARFFGIDDSKLCIRNIEVGPGQRPRRVEFKGRGRTGMQRLSRAKVLVRLQEVQFG